MSGRRALVIGGGGVTGIAWATGLLYGLEQMGVHLRQAERLVGTSAGSAVTAQLTGTLSLEELYRRQIEGTVAELPGAMGVLGALHVAFPLLVRRDLKEALRTVGRYSLSQGSERAQARRSVIEQRVDGMGWDPERDLSIAAIDIDAGERTVFRAGGPASLTDAVEASCAVPGVWPVATIAGHRYMDGGVASLANVDLAGDANRVVVIAPLLRGMKSSGSPRVEFAALGRTGRVISPDAAAKAQLGSNPLDPAARVSSAKAGREQAAREADRIRPVWGE